MAKGTRGRRGIASRQCRPTPYPLPSRGKNCSKILEKKDWEDATCSVCMECPHNAVLLLCSSHEKGCRPYMCGTSFRHSNCLDQYKNAYAKSTPPNTTPLVGLLDVSPLGPHRSTELACPLCRGQVKGWTVVEPAREHLNSKKRTCMQDNCSFLGTYKELRKHVKADHPEAKPREVDPTLEQKWRRLEREREREDVMSTIRSSMPGAVFFGDYVIEGSHYDDNDDSDDDEEEEEEGFDAMGRNEVGVNRNLMSVFLFLQAFGSSGNAGPNRSIRNDEDGNDDDNDGDDGGNYGTSLAGRLRRQGRMVLSRSARRRRHREATGDGR